LVVFKEAAMRYIILILLVSSLFLSTDLNAVETQFESLGVSVSSFSGMGLSFRHHFANRWALQLTGGALIGNEEKSFATGIEVQSDLSSKKDKRFFLIMAAGWYGDRENVIKKGSADETTPIDVSYYKLSVGFGGELAFGDSIVQNITIGMAIFPIGVSVKERHSFAGYDNTDSVSFGASIFSHFNF
jgi:hypothetical protein